MARALKRMAHEILERNGTGPLVLAGIPTRGVPLARRLAGCLADSAVRLRSWSWRLKATATTATQPSPGTQAAG